MFRIPFLLMVEIKVTGRGMIPSRIKGFKSMVHLLEIEIRRVREVGIAEKGPERGPRVPEF